MQRTIKYHLSYSHISKFPHSSHFHILQWARMDSNHRTPERTDLQSVVVGHLTTCPNLLKSSSAGNTTPNIFSAVYPAYTLSHLLESNLRPTDYKSVALPAELRWRLMYTKKELPQKFWECKGNGIQ